MGESDFLRSVDALRPKHGLAPMSPAEREVLAHAMHTHYDDGLQERKEAEKGNRHLRRKLAMRWAACLFSGYPLAQNDSEQMLAWLQEIGPRRDGEVAEALATLHGMGYGVPQDYRKAYRLFRRADDPHYRQQDMARAFDIRAGSWLARRRAIQAVSGYAFTIEQLFGYRISSMTYDTHERAGDAHFAMLVSPCHGKVVIEAAPEQDIALDQALMQRVVDDITRQLTPSGVGCDVQTAFPEIGITFTRNH